MTASRIRLRRDRQESASALARLDDAQWKAAYDKRLEDGIEAGKAIKEQELNPVIDRLHAELHETRRELDKAVRRMAQAEETFGIQRSISAQLQRDKEALESEVRRLKAQGPLSLLQNKVQHATHKRNKGKGTTTSRGGQRRSVPGRVRRG